MHALVNWVINYPLLSVVICNVNFHRVPRKSSIFIALTVRLLFNVFLHAQCAFPTTFDYLLMFTESQIPQFRLVQLQHFLLQQKTINGCTIFTANREQHNNSDFKDIKSAVISALF